MLPTHIPSLQPSSSPTSVHVACSNRLADVISNAPMLPTHVPSLQPSSSPTSVPTPLPPGMSHAPTYLPTSSPTHVPSHLPSRTPTAAPTPLPPGMTHAPSASPTTPPTHVPSLQPSSSPTSVPTPLPPGMSHAPTDLPTISPTRTPSYTSSPTAWPTALLPSSVKVACPPASDDCALHLKDGQQCQQVCSSSDQVSVGLGTCVHLGDTSGWNCSSSAVAPSSEEQAVLPKGVLMGSARCLAISAGANSGDSGISTRAAKLLTSLLRASLIGSEDASDNFLRNALVDGVAVALEVDPSTVSISRIHAMRCEAAVVGGRRLIGSKTLTAPVEVQSDGADADAILERLRALNLAGSAQQLTFLAQVRKAHGLALSNIGSWTTPRAFPDEVPVFSSVTPTPGSALGSAAPISASSHVLAISLALGILVLIAMSTLVGAVFCRRRHRPRQNVNSQIDSPDMPPIFSEKKGETGPCDFAVDYDEQIQPAPLLWPVCDRQLDTSLYKGGSASLMSPREEHIPVPRLKLQGWPVSPSCASDFLGAGEEPDPETTAISSGMMADHVGNESQDQCGCATPALSVETGQSVDTGWSCTGCASGEESLSPLATTPRKGVAGAPGRDLGAARRLSQTGDSADKAASVALPVELGGGVRASGLPAPPDRLYEDASDDESVEDMNLSARPCELSLAGWKKDGRHRRRFHPGEALPPLPLATLGTASPSSTEATQTAVLLLNDAALECAPVALPSSGGPVAQEAMSEFVQDAKQLQSGGFLCAGSGGVLSIQRGVGSRARGLIVERAEKIGADEFKSGVMPRRSAPPSDVSGLSTFGGSSSFTPRGISSPRVFGDEGASTQGGSTPHVSPSSESTMTPTPRNARPQNFCGIIANSPATPAVATASADDDDDDVQSALTAYNDSKQRLLDVQKARTLQAQAAQNVGEEIHLVMWESSPGLATSNSRSGQAPALRGSARQEQLQSLSTMTAFRAAAAGGGHSTGRI
eukprot:TRINITY_DN4408_c0_g1_i17.p1 TRINITY_DN4408_c0_g1~~TRINITY_DN4408_c0_g1_i17.p1  ORF type:complete len:1041 (+),score=135.67 TRINITY_DN4408_c0_g1_i17:157-3123(+)